MRRAATSGDGAPLRLCSRAGSYLRHCPAPAAAKLRPGQQLDSSHRLGHHCSHQRWARVGEHNLSSRHAAVHASAEDANCFSHTAFGSSFASVNTCDAYVVISDSAQPRLVSSVQESCLSELQMCTCRSLHHTWWDEQPGRAAAIE